jgi:hypothetical protein
MGGSDDKDPPFSWDLTFEYEKTITPNDGGPDIVDTTYDYSGTLGFLSANHWGLNATMEYSNTPDEQLVARGGRVSLSYRYDYGPLDQQYLTYTNFKLIAGDTNYLEAFNGQEPKGKNSKKTKPVSGTAELRQTQLGIDLTWKATKRWKFDAEFDHYSYNRDVGAFEDQLNSPLALQMGEAGFNNTVGGLPRVTYTAGVFWEFSDGWRLNATEQYSLLAVDESVSTVSKLTVSDQINRSWKVTVGAEYLQSEVLTDTLAILGVLCEL